jgi:ATP-dependent DNA helicase DinG
VVVALLPIASLEDPLTAARVAALRRQGRDWFRELLLPEALNRLQRGLAGLRRGGGRLAVLDGRLRGRGWGRQVFTALEPWIQLSRLLPGG